MEQIYMQEHMENKMTTQMNSNNSGLVNYNPGNATLLEMREDPERFPRLQAVSFAEAVFEMSKIVAMASMYRGQNLDKTNIEFIASTLVTELLDDKVYNPGVLSFAEIQHVIKRAVLETDLFVSVSSLYRVIMDFAKGEGKANCEIVLAKKRQKMKEEEERRLKAAGASQMMQAYTGEFLRNNKINRKRQNQ